MVRGRDLTKEEITALYTFSLWSDGEYLSDSKESVYLNNLKYLQDRGIQPPEDIVTATFNRYIRGSGVFASDLRRVLAYLEAGIYPPKETEQSVYESIRAKLDDLENSYGPLVNKKEVSDLRRKFENLVPSSIR